jgi:hypothetical protein
MTEEEAYYWFSKTTSSKTGRGRRERCDYCWPMSREAALAS